MLQVSRRTRRITGTLADAKATHAELLLEVQEQRSKSGSLAPGGSCPTLAEWFTGRYARWQERARNERTRRKLVSPIRYLLASDLAGLSLDKIGTAEINAYVDWRRSVGAISFSTRKDGQRYRARVEQVGAQTINKSLKLLSAALHLAKDESVIASVPKIHFLPEDDARAIIPPTEEQYRALIRGAEQFRPSPRCSRRWWICSANSGSGPASCSISPGEAWTGTWARARTGAPSGSRNSSAPACSAGIGDPQEPEAPDHPLHAVRAGDLGSAPRQGEPQGGRAGDPQHPRAPLHPPGRRGL